MSASFLGHVKSFTPTANLFNNLKKINPSKRTFFHEDKINKTEDYVRTNKLISQNCGSKHIIKPNSGKIPIIFLLKPFGFCKP